MQKKKQVFTWQFSTLVIVVSFLSILAVWKQVEAVWTPPNYLPNDTNLVNTFVFTPLAQNLDLGGRNIIGNGNISITGAASFTSLTVGGVPYVPSGGGGGSSSDWAINNLANNDLYYTTSTLLASGDVGIGTNNPSHRLHILATDVNSEIDLQTGGSGGDDSHWGIYHANSAGDTPANSNDLRFWKGGLDRVTFTNTGEVGIGTVSPNKLLHLYSTSPNAELNIQSVTGAGNHWGVYHDAASNDLRFWKGGADRVTFADTGEIGINVVPNTNYQLSVNGDVRSAIYGGVGVNNIAAIHGVNSYNHTGMNSGAIAIRAEASSAPFTGGTGLWATGNYGMKVQGVQYGIWTSASIGEAIYAEGSAGGAVPLHVKANGASGAANFEGGVDVSGLLKVNGNLQITGTDNYLYITSGSGAPTLACSIGGTGRVYLDYTNFRLYICTSVSGGWKYATLQ